MSKENNKAIAGYEEITPEEAKELLKDHSIFALSISRITIARIVLSAMDTVETYWASNNDKAIQTANNSRRKFREVFEEIAKENQQ